MACATPLSHGASSPTTHFQHGPFQHLSPIAKTHAFLLCHLTVAAGAATVPPSGSELAGGPSSSCPAVPGLLFSRIGHTQQDLQDMMELANARQVGAALAVGPCSLSAILSAMRSAVCDYGHDS